MLDRFVAFVCGLSAADLTATNALDLTVTNEPKTPKTTATIEFDAYPEPLDYQPEHQTDENAHAVIAEFVDWLGEQGVSGVVTVDTIESEFYEFAFATGNPLFERGLFFTTLSAHGIKRQKKQIDLDPEGWRYRIDKRRGRARPRRSTYVIPLRVPQRLAA